MALLPIGKTACVVHQAKVVCSEPWISIPEPVEGLAIGDGHAFAVAASGSLYFWGKGQGGKIEPPTRLPGLGKIVDVALEVATPICAVDATGKLFCWGVYYEVPTHVPTPAPVIEVAPCQEGPCVILEGGVLAVIGSDRSDGGAILRAFVIPGTQGFTSPAYAWTSYPDGARFACGIRAGRVACAGDGTTDYRDKLTALGAATSFSGNSYDACVVTPEQRVRCLGRGGPIEIAGVEGAVEVVVRGTGDRACARLKDGGVRCFDTVPGPQELHDPIAAAAARR